MLLSGKLTVNEKLKIIETEYDITLVMSVGEKVNGMCNLKESWNRVRKPVLEKPNSRRRGI